MPALAICWHPQSLLLLGTSTLHRQRCLCEQGVPALWRLNHATACAALSSQGATFRGWLAVILKEHKTVAESVFMPEVGSDLLVAVIEVRRGCSCAALHDKLSGAQGT